MTAFVFILILIGFVINSIGAVMILVAAFRESIWWGLGSIFLPFVGLVFLITHWEECKPGIKLELLGFSFAVLGMAIAMRIGISKSDLSITGSHEPDPADEIFSASADITQDTGSAGTLLTKLQDTQASLFSPEPESTPEPEQHATGPHKYVGMSVAEARKLLGEPRGELITGEKIMLDYPHIQLVSEDGKTVSQEKPR